MSLKVLFVRCGFGREGIGHVTQLVAQQFHQAGIEVAYYTGQLWDSFEKPYPDLQIYFASNSSDFFSQENRNEVIDLAHKEGFDIIFILGELFFTKEDAKKLGQTKTIFWLHLQPFREYLVSIQPFIKKKSFIHRQIYPVLSGIKKAVTYFAHKHKGQKYKQAIEVHDRVIVLCDAYKEQIARHLSLDNSLRQNIQSMTNELSTIPEYPSSADKENLVVYMGRMSKPDKRVHLLLQIWASVERRVPLEWHLELWGDGPDIASFKKTAKDLGLKRAEFCGSTDKPLEVFRRAKISCLTSALEGWPLVLEEAQCMGCIPMSFNNYAAVYDIIGEDTLYGRIVSNNNLNEYADKLIELCHDEELQESIRQRLKVKREEYRPGVNMPKWRHLIKELTGKEF